MTTTATMPLPKRIEDEAARLRWELDRGDRDAARETLAIPQAKLTELATELSTSKPFTGC